MTDKKISALTGALTPLIGTEVLPIVQSGATVKVAVSDLTLGRAVNTNGGTFSDNQTQGVAAKGINFTANTPVAGMTSQLLNWYEEGTWTPAFATWSTAPTIASAKYTRIGRQMTIHLNFYDGACVDYSTITGLPFTSNATIGGIATMSSSDVTKKFTAMIVTSSTSIINIPAQNLSGPVYCQLVATYMI